MMVAVRRCDLRRIFFLKILFIFEDRGREGETLVCERYIDRLPLSHPQMGTWPTTQPCALAGNPTSDLLVCRSTH